MPSPSSEPLSPILRTSTLIETVVLFVSGLGLLLFADLIVPIWAWPISVGTSRFLGAVYLTACVPVGVQALRSDWEVGHVTLPMIGVFTTAVLILSLVFLGGFSLDQPVAWAWLAAYIILPIIAIIFLRQYWGRPVPDAITLQGIWPSLLRVWLALHIVYTLALLIAPGPATSWWPWTIETLDARIYSAQFLTLATGAWLLTRPTHRAAIVTIGWMQIVIGVLALAGRGIYSLMEGHLNFAPGALIWHAYFVAVMLMGLALLRAARQPA